MRQVKLDTSKLSTYYKYDRGYGLEGHLVLRGKNQDQFTANMIGGELNILSKWIWGTGMSANSIYNAHGFSVKFQGPKDLNLTRAKLLARVWRWCRRQGYHISSKQLPRWYSENGKYKFREMVPGYLTLIKEIEEIYESKN